MIYPDMIHPDMIYTDMTYPFILAQISQGSGDSVSGLQHHAGKP